MGERDTLDDGAALDSCEGEGAAQNRCPLDAIHPVFGFIARPCRHAGWAPGTESGVAS